MITTTNHILLPLDINEMPLTIPNGLIDKKILIHEMKSDTHESVMKSSRLILDNGLSNLTAFW